MGYTSLAWDASVSVTNGVHLVRENDLSLVLVQNFNLNGSYHEPIRPLVHDPQRDYLYISGAIQKNATFIYRINLKTKFQERLVVNDSNMPGKMDGKILGLEHDYTKNVLYWSTGKGGKIIKLDLNSYHLEQNVLHNSDITNLITSGLAIDECSRTLFWTSYIVRDGRGFIESSKLDGSNRVQLHSDKLHNPTDITVDQVTRKLYWCDMKDGSSYSIERSNLDGSVREIIIEGSGVEPISIALSAKYVYWVNYGAEKVERMEKLTKNIKDKNMDYEPDKPRGIASRKVIQQCSRENEDTDFEFVPNSSDNQAAKNGIERTITSGTYDTQSGDASCLNGGYHETSYSPEFNENLKCKCPSGFRGQLCEKCDYCVNGRCTAGRDNSVSCICDRGFSGLQCEQNVCYNYCLNGGKCIVGNDSKPMCNCSNTTGTGNYHGPRCELDCKLFCQSNTRIIIVDLGKTVCSCGVNNGKVQNTTSSDMSYEEFQRNILYTLIGTCVLCVIFLIIIIFLLCLISKLRKRPRIKKRIIVNKNITPTPLTSRPPPIGEQCEITIENCCNMNICETPCYEPQLRSSDKSLSKTEEKKNLLRNMEEGESGTASQDTLY